MSEIMLRIENVSKQYVLGQIGGTTLRDELQRLSARLHHREDPTKRIGSRDYTPGETFMALDEVSFDVMRGERVGIIGHNGAGKSTLLKLISRVTAPTGGRIGLNGRVASMLEVGTGFHGELTGRENIYMNGAILGMKKREIDEKIEDIIEFSECRQFIDTPVKRYSSGMYVKLAFSVAAHLDSEIMIMDEVLAVGDMKFQEKCLGKMNDVSKAEGRTILYVSHNMNTIRQLCDRCIVLDHGKVIFDGEVERGIDTYRGSVGNLAVSVDLTEKKHETHAQTRFITMTSLACNGVNEAVFDTGAKIKFCLECSAVQTVNNVYFRVTIKSAGGEPVTMATTDQGLELNRGKNTLQFILNASNLVPGRYLLTLTMYEVNELGQFLHLDVVHDAYCFEIRQNQNFNNNMPWQTRYWGHFYNEPIIMWRE